MANKEGGESKTCSNSVETTKKGAFFLCQEKYDLVSFFSIKVIFFGKRTLSHLVPLHVPLVPRAVERPLAVLVHEELPAAAAGPQRVRHSVAGGALQVLALAYEIPICFSLRRQNLF